MILITGANGMTGHAVLKQLNALTEPGYEYGVFEAASAKQPLTRHELAAIWARVTGRAIRAVTMPLDAYMALPHWAGRDPAEMAILRTMFEEFDRNGAPGGNWRVLAMPLGREPTRYETFAEKFAIELGVFAGDNQHQET